MERRPDGERMAFAARRNRSDARAVFLSARIFWSDWTGVFAKLFSSALFATHFWRGWKTPRGKGIFKIIPFANTACVIYSARERQSRHLEQTDANRRCARRHRDIAVHRHVLSSGHPAKRADAAADFGIAKTNSDRGGKIK